MFSNSRTAKHFLLSISCCAIALLAVGLKKSFAADSLAASEHSTSNIVASKNIILNDLRKYPQTTIEVDDQGSKVKYSGVSLRLLLAEMLTDCKIDSMPEWKALTKRELVMELKATMVFLLLLQQQK